MVKCKAFKTAEKTKVLCNGLAEEKKDAIVP